MWIDNKGKLFGKISIIDIIIVLVVLGGVVGLSYKFIISKTVSSLTNASNVEVKFYVEESPTYSTKNIKTGELTGDYERETVFGKLKEMKVEDAFSLGVDAQGKFVRSSKPGYSSVTFSIDGNGVFNEKGGVTFNNIDYFIGKSMVLKVGNAVFYGRICEFIKKG